MSNYAKSTDFASKDTLPSGDSAKIVRGTEIDAEFEAIETSIATKADLASPALTGSPTAPTPTAGDNDTSIATTEFVSTAVSNAVAAGFGFKNRIINGAMVIDQRNAGASVTPAGTQYTLDRWASQVSQSAKFTVQQTPSATETGFATRVNAGFTNYLACTSSSAYSVLTGDFFTVTQGVEGLNVADLAWGTANAKTVTLSFLVYSSLTGTFGGVVKNLISSATRSYPFTFTVSSANTWTSVSVTIAGDTSGTWATNNGVGLCVCFGLGVGATYSGTAGSWAGSNLFSATGATSVVGTNGATFYITGVQLEKGSTATSFDYRPYGTELQLCQRYYQKLTMSARGYCQGSTYLTGGALSWVPMRVTPSWSRVSGPSSSLNLYSGSPYGSLSSDANNSGYFFVQAAAAGDTYAYAVLYESTGTEL